MQTTDVVELLIDVAFETGYCKREGRESSGKRVGFLGEGTAEGVFDAGSVSCGTYFERLEHILPDGFIDDLTPLSLILHQKSPFTIQHLKP